MCRFHLPRTAFVLAVAGLFATVLLSAFPLGAGQIPPTWVAQVPLGDPGSEMSMLGAGTLADGSVLIVLGHMQGLRVVHASASGDLLGTARFWAPSFNFSGGLWVVVEPGGDVIAGGQGRTPRGDYWLMRFDGLTGAWRWRSPVVWGGYDGRAQWIRALSLDGDGNVLVTGSAEESTTDVATLKVSGTSGEILWGPVLFDTGADDSPTALSVDKAGNVAVVGGSWTDSNRHLFAVQYEGSSGKEVWRFEWKGAKTAGALVREWDGGLIVSAEPAAGPGTALVALSPEGAVRWSRVLDTPDASLRRAVLALAPDRGFYGDAFFVVGVSGTDQVIWKLAVASGFRIWGPVVRPGTAGASPHQPRIATTPEGDLVIQSESWEAQPTPQTSIYGIHGSSGRLRWGPLVIPDRGLGGLLSLVTDAVGNPFVIAIGRVTRSSPSSVTFARVSRTDGSFLSGPVELPGDLPIDYPKTVLVDGHGDVVTLVTEDLYWAHTAAVAKIEAATGRLLWGPIPISPPLNANSSRIGLDPSGDVFWASFFYSEPTNSPVVVYGKLRGDTGLPVWGPIPYGAGHADVAGLAVAGSDFALLVRNRTAGAMQLAKVSGETGALSYPPVSVGPTTEGYLPVRERIVFRAGLLAVCTGATALVESSTGAIRWGPRGDLGTGPCALDDSGNLFRSLSITNAEPGTQLVKSSALNGSVIWSTFLPDIYAKGIAVDPEGDVTIASTSASWPPRLDVRKLAGETGTPLWGPVTWDDPASLESAGLDVAITPFSDVVFLGSTMDVTATNALVLRLSGRSGEPLAPPLLYGNGSETYPRSLGLAGDQPVIGVMSSLLGSAVVSWQLPRIRFDAVDGQKK